MDWRCNNFLCCVSIKNVHRTDRRINVVEVLK
jgi:hypothetical protein